jgi:transcription elongation factor GreA
MKKQINILPEKSKELEKNIHLLEKIKIELKMASLDGDLKENTDWINLLKKFGLLKAQIARSEAAMREEELERDKKNSLYNQFITYRILKTNEEKTVQLTSKNEIVSGEQGKISLASPLGQALQEKKIGTIITVKAPQKNYQIKILNIQ